MTKLEERKKMYAELLERGNNLLPKALEVIENSGTPRIDYGSPGVNWFTLIRLAFNGLWVDSRTRHNFSLMLEDAGDVEPVYFRMFGIAGPKSYPTGQTVKWAGSFDQPLERALKVIRESTTDHEDTPTKLMDRNKLIERITGQPAKGNKDYAAISYSIYRSSIMFRGTVVVFRQNLGDHQAANEVDKLLKLKQRTKNEPQN
jgi:hypothetical protein